MELTGPEIRVLGCLLEKQRTTPEVYPLTLNALRLACNQSTSRDPVVDYDEGTIREALRTLQRRGMARFTSGHTSRSSKYRHLLDEALPMQPDEQTLMCVLMLRGAQTPGALKQRTERLHAFADLGELGDALQRLIDRGLVARLERRPGQKEERYKHLLGGGEDVETPSEGAEAAASGAGLGVPEEVEAASSFAPATAGLPPAGAERQRLLAELEQRVSRLEQEVRELHSALLGASHGPVDEQTCASDGPAGGAPLSGAEPAEEAPHSSPAPAEISQSPETPSGTELAASDERAAGGEHVY